MSVPFSLVIIKPMSIGRGHGPDILAQMLREAPLALRNFRSWAICKTTLRVLCENSSLNYKDEEIHLGRMIPSWVCIFTHLDRKTDPTESILEITGPDDRDLWRPRHMRYQYSGSTGGHVSDTVVYVSDPKRVIFESLLLFEKFDSSNV